MGGLLGSRSSQSTQVHFTLDPLAAGAIDRGISPFYLGLTSNEERLIQAAVTWAGITRAVHVVDSEALIRDSVSLD